MQYRKISENNIMRLSLYERYVCQLEQADEKMVSSEQLAQIAGVNASNVRKDLQFLGEIGARGLGYDVTKLKQALQTALGYDQMLSLAIVGADHLGKALLNYYHQEVANFKVVHVFDEDSDLIGQRIKGITVKSLKSWEKNLLAEPVDIAVIASEPEDPQAWADLLVQAGVKAVLNFSMTKLPLPDFIEYKHLDVNGALNYLRFQLVN